MKRSAMKHGKGRTKKRWEEHHARSRAAVILRSKGNCEAQRFPFVHPGEQWAHAFGRRNIVGEPLASLPSMTFWLCAHCHSIFDQHMGTMVEFQRELRWRAILQTMKVLPPGLVDWLGEWNTQDDPVAIARTIDRLWLRNLRDTDLEPFYAV